MAEAARSATIVGQIVNLRRIVNPPVAPGWQGRQRGTVRCASRRRMNNPPQVTNLVTNLPHKAVRIVSKYIIEVVSKLV